MASSVANIESRNSEGRRTAQHNAADANLARIMTISVPLSVTLAEHDMPIEAIVKIAGGTIIEFDVPFDSELTLSIAGRPIGRGRAVKVGENFGLQVSRINTVEDRIDALGRS